MKPTVTPLRYPGGKTWLIPYVKNFLKFHSIQHGTVIEPFAGSASVTIGLLDASLMEKGVICENDPLIIAFWQSVLYHNHEFSEAVSGLEITMDTWCDFKKYLEPDSHLKYSTMDLATAFLFYNRTNYSGVISAGPIGGKRQQSKYSLTCRFNKERTIKKIKALEKFNERIDVVFHDGISFIKRYENCNDSEDVFFYIDPPYYKAGKVLYRNFFKDLDHMELSNVVKSLEYPWLVSYDECNFIYELYKGTETNYVFTDYQSGHLRRRVREMLFSNRKIPPITDALCDNKIAENEFYTIIQN